MDVVTTVTLELFVGLLLVAGSLLLLAYSVKQADHEHADRLSLLPTEREQTVQTGPRAKEAE